MDYYKAGKEEFLRQLFGGEKPNLSKDDFEKAGGIVPEVGGSDEWSAYFTGSRDAEKEYVDTLVPRFLKEFKELCEKHKAWVCVGCGCCGGANIQDSQGRTWDITDRI